MPDFSTADEQREFGVVIPDGTFCRLRAHIRRPEAGYTLAGENPVDNNLFRLSPNGSVMLDFEFVVLGGQHANAKLYQLMVVKGGPDGAVDNQGRSVAGNITKQTLRAMCESANNVEPADKSPYAVSMRQPAAYSALHNIEFAARIGVQEGELKDDGSGSRYPDKNMLAHVVVPGEPEYLPAMQCQPLEPKPTGARPARVKAGAAAPPQGALWGPGQAAPAAAPAPQAPPAPAYAPPPVYAAPAPAPVYAAPNPQPQPVYAQPQPQPQPAPQAQPVYAAPAPQPAPAPAPQPVYAAPAPQPQPQPQPQPAPVAYAPPPGAAAPVPDANQGGPSWLGR